MQLNSLASNTSYVLGLLDLLQEQGETIAIQNDTIAKLINENLEKENMINVLAEELKLEQL